MSSLTTQTTPTLNQSVIGITTLAQGARTRVTANLDLRTKLGGMLHTRIGRGGNTALTSGIVVYVEPIVNAAGSPTRIQPYVMFPTTTQIAAAAATTCAASGNTAGTTTLGVASTTGMAAGDLICIQDNATPTAGGTEWHRVSKVTNSTTLELCEPLETTHANAAHTVRNMADVQTIPLPGGQAYALVIDYGASTTGNSATIEAIVETLDSLSTS